jgi:hypothetical protein
MSSIYAKLRIIMAKQQLIGLPEIETILGKTKSGTHWIVTQHKHFPAPVQEFKTQGNNTMRLYDKKDVLRFKKDFYPDPKKS